MAGYGRPRIQSATRTGGDGSSMTMMNMTGMTNMIAAQNSMTDMWQANSGHPMHHQQ